MEGDRWLATLNTHVIVIEVDAVTVCVTVEVEVGFAEEEDEERVMVENRLVLLVVGKETTAVDCAPDRQLVASGRGVMTVLSRSRFLP